MKSRSRSSVLVIALALAPFVGGAKCIEYDERFGMDPEELEASTAETAGTGPSATGPATGAAAGPTTASGMGGGGGGGASAAGAGGSGGAAVTTSGEVAVTSSSSSMVPELVPAVPCSKPNRAVIKVLASSYANSCGCVEADGFNCTVAVGTTVQWLFVDSEEHNVKSAGGKFEDSDDLLGGTFEQTFLVPDTYDYSCSLHSSMKGYSIIVVGS